MLDLGQIKLSLHCSLPIMARYQNLINKRGQCDATELLKPYLLILHYHYEISIHINTGPS